VSIALQPVLLPGRNPKELVLTFAGNIVKHLGVQMYAGRPTPAIAELAWGLLDWACFISSSLERQGPKSPHRPPLQAEGVRPPLLLNLRANFPAPTFCGPQLA
jgi:hypothetical protein